MNRDEQALPHVAAPLRGNVDMLVGVLNGSADPIAVFDSACRLLVANRAWSALAGLAGYADAFGDTLLPRLLARALEGESQGVLVEFGEAGDRRSYEISASPLPTAAGEAGGAVLGGRELTGQRRAERTVAELNDRMRGLEREIIEIGHELESLSYTVTHDLRAPLRAVDGFADMLARRAGERLDEEDKRLLGVVRESGRTLGRLFDKLLALSRLTRQRMAPTRIEMGELVRDAWLDIGPKFHGEFQLDALPPVLCDRILLKQVWLHLLDNAIKFSAHRALPRIMVDGWCSGHECVYRVRDNGIGFDMRYAGRLFGVFQRLHAVDEFPGDGIGLASVSRVIARHGGRVWAEGQRDAGAAFHFALPMTNADAPPAFHPPDA